MSAALREPMTLAAFLNREELQELRYEFDAFQPVAMTAGPPGMNSSATGFGRF